MARQHLYMPGLDLNPKETAYECDALPSKVPEPGIVAQNVRFLWVINIKTVPFAS